MNRTMTKSATKTMVPRTDAVSQRGPRGAQFLVLRGDAASGAAAFLSGHHHCGHHHLTTHEPQHRQQQHSKLFGGFGGVSSKDKKGKTVVFKPVLSERHKEIVQLLEKLY